MRTGHARKSGGDSIPEAVFGAMLDRIAWLALVLGGIGTLVSLVRPANPALRISMLMDGVVYLLAVPAFLLRRRIPYRVLMAYLVAVVAGGTFVSMWVLGLADTGLKIFTVLAVLAVVFFETRAAAWVMAGLLVLALLAGVVTVTGLVKVPMDWESYLRSPWTWAVYLAGWVVYGMAAVSAVWLLKSKYVEALERRAEEGRRLAESEARYRLLAENMTDGVFVQGMDFRVRFASPSLLTMFGGVREEEVLGQDGALWMTPESAGRARETFAVAAQAAMRGEVDPPLMEYEYVRKDGSRFWGEVRVKFLRDGEGRPVGVQGVLRDITARKRAEEERDQLRRELERSERLRVVGRLAEGVGHAFNNHLTAIMGYADLIKVSSSDEPAKEYASAVVAAARSAAEEVRRLLVFSREDLKVDCEVLDLGEAVRWVVETMGRGLPGRVRLRSEASVSPVHVVGHGELLRSALTAVCRNALEAVEARGGEVVLTTGTVVGEKVAETVKGRWFDRSRGYGFVAVRDTGPGMSPEQMEHLFEPFFTTKPPPAVGLGLPAALHAVEVCGGGIVVDSVLGRGSVVTLFVPLASGGCGGCAGAGGGLGRVLVVDDEPLVREVLTSYLRKSGYACEAAGSGMEALEVVKSGRFRPDAVILDLRMSGEPVGEVFGALRRLVPEAAIFLASGYGGREASELLEKGAAGFFAKPFDLVEVDRRLRRAGRRV